MNISLLSFPKDLSRLSSQKLTCSNFPSSPRIHFAGGYWRAGPRVRRPRLGAGGIGVILKAKLQGDQYEEAGLILLAVFITVLSIEAVSKAIRRRLA